MTWIDGEPNRIPLSGGKAFAVVDSSDWPEVSQYTWCLLNADGKQYAVREEPMQNGRRGKQILMHRQLLCAEDGQLCDHNDGDGLNNRRSNIRIATAAENAQNTRKARGGSRFKGVSWEKRWNHWRVVIQVDGKQKYIGSFNDEVEAAKAYNKAAEEHFGGFAYLNDVDAVCEKEGVEWLPSEKPRHPVCSKCGQCIK